MSLWQSVLMFFCGLGLVQSFFLGTTLIIKDRLNFNALFYFGLLLFGLALRLAKSYFIFIPQQYPHWGVVAGAAGLCLIGPAFFLYTLHSINHQKKPTYFYVIHFLPSLVILVGSITDYVYYLGLAQAYVYFSLSIYRVAKTGYAKLPRHFVVFAISVGLILLCFTAQAMKGGIEVYTIGAGIAMSILYAINYFIVSDSGFLQMFVKKSKTVDQKLATKIAADLDSVFGEKKLYRNKGLTIAMVAQQIDCPAYLISQAINQQHGIRFNEFVNRFRVQEAMEILKSKNDKIEVIAKEVGFSSMSSLYEAFKKETHLTPQGYRNEFSGSVEI